MSHLRVRRGCDPQEFHELRTDFSRGFVLCPVARIVEFETSNETGKADADLLLGKWTKLSRAIRLLRDVKEGWVIFAPFQAADKTGSVALISGRRLS